MASKLDLFQLVKEIRNMNYRQKIYKVLKQELTSLGYWRVKGRGDAKKGYQLGWGKHRELR